MGSAGDQAPVAGDNDWDEVMRLVRSKGSFDINLKKAEIGKVVTRFPPEPSGFLHIGHAKAALMNDFFARKYKGKLIVRFDDTNTEKATQNFEDNIVKDLKDMGIKPDVIEYTSDYFLKLQDFAEEFIKNGKAYVDGTSVEEMREQRRAKRSNKYREQTVEQNLELWREMLKGSSIGMQCCLRAKISMTSNNGCMRDPIMYRCKSALHHRTGDTYKAYPTYDFSCPIVDSLSGVTHALRTLEYQDRNIQYEWFAKAASLRVPFVWGFSRLNFTQTVLSKRKLQKLVDIKAVSGWDDPRFPTIQGIRRRGLTIQGLRAFILSQGASRNSTTQQWDKIWTVNKRVIDPVAPRYTAISSSKFHTAALFKESSDSGAEPVPYPDETKFIPRNKKNKELGSKLRLCGSHVLLEEEDAKEMYVGEVLTMMDLGNVRVDSALPEIRLCFLPNNLDFKRTRKITWLAKVPDLVPMELYSYGPLLKADVPEEDPDAEAAIEEKVNKESESIDMALGDVNTRMLQKGDIVQLERRGYFIVDRVWISEGKPMKLIMIPDGRVAQKAFSNEASTKGTENKGTTKDSGTGLSKKELKLLKKKEKKEKKARAKAARQAEQLAATTEDNLGSAADSKPPASLDDSNAKVET